MIEIGSVFQGKYQILAQIGKGGKKKVNSFGYKFRKRTI